MLQVVRVENLDVLRSQDPALAGWIDSLVWGNGRAIPPTLRDTFKATGVFHLLSVSGSHVTALILAATSIMLAPWYLAHLFGLCAGHHWTFARRWIPVSIGPLIAGYVLIVGSSQAALRSGLIGISHLMGRIGGEDSGQRNQSQRLLRIAAIQSALLPGDFISGANLMSWVGYLTILHVQGCATRKSSKQMIALALLLMQIELSLWSAICFRQISLIGIVANGILVPLFGPVFWLAVGLALAPTLFLCLGGHLVQAIFLSLVELAGGIVARHPWLYLNDIAWKDWQLAMAVIFGMALTGGRVAALLHSQQGGDAGSQMLQAP